MLLATAETRRFRPPRRLRGLVADTVDSWDLLPLATSPGPAQEWAQATLEGVLAAADAEAAAARGCTDCADTGFYGIADVRDPDLLVRLLKRRGENGYEVLLDTGEWVAYDPEPIDVEMIDVETAGDLASVVTAGGRGLLRRWVMPLMFLPSVGGSAALVAAADLPRDSEEWFYCGIVDDADTEAVLDVVRVNSFGAQRLIDGEWVADDDDLAGDLTLAPLDEQVVAALVADAPLTVSPDPRAEKLRRYWSTGRGGFKIKWNLPSDWRRCYRHLRKYMGLRAKGYCANLHKRNTGMWPGDRRNRGLISSMPEDPISPEHQLVASIQDGSWTQQEGTPAMGNDTLPDGIYCEASADDAVLRTLLAGGFPVDPPDAWFAKPELKGPTPMSVDDSGQVKGHIATWDSIHIGMAGAVRAPKSRSGYAYFQTGQIKTDSGNSVSVGQLTLAGGHASLQADAQSAVKHYDDTNSAVADVTVGEDQYGIWAAGALRPSVTPEQLRTFRASPLSGDWRPINGNLELVAACAVNVPGFPIARARVASGSVQALVAAGAGPLAVIAAAQQSETAISARLDRLEQMVAALTPTAGENPVPAAAAVADESQAQVEVETTEVPEVDGEKLPDTDDEQIAAVREEIAAVRAEQLRNEVSGMVVAAGAPPFVKKGERAGIGGYPINNEKDLKNAIQAFGRSKPADRARTKAHIISRAKALGLSSLIPDDWK